MMMPRREAIGEQRERPLSEPLPRPENGMQSRVHALLDVTPEYRTGPRPDRDLGGTKGVTVGISHNEGVLCCHNRMHTCCFNCL
jgi:hypothetical protein